MRNLKMSEVIFRADVKTYPCPLLFLRQGLFWK